MKRVRLAVVVVLGLVVAGANFGIPLQADTSAASIAGTVSDPSASVIAGAQVTVRNLLTGVERRTLTNAVGAYRVAGLPAGEYEMEITYGGFRPWKLSYLLLRVGDELRGDATLTLQGSDRIDVSGALTATPSESSATSTVINERQIQELPLNGRQLQNLALLTPGVAAGWNLSTAANRYGKARENLEGAFVVNGARGRSNNFVLDGMPMNLRQYGVINFEPSNEAVQEFELKTVPQAEFGRTMGSTVNMVTRGGTNRFHGSLYEFVRNDKLDANDTFNNRAGLPRGKVRQNQFGGSFGGPIYRQKHFFFVNAEFLRNLEGVETRLTSVPTPAEAKGLLEYLDPMGAPQMLDLSSRITPLSRRLLQFYPTPNASGPAGLNYNSSLTIALNDYQFHVRTDHQLTDRDSVSVRTSWNLNDQVYLVNRFGGPFLPGFSLPNPENTVNATVGWLHVFGPNAISEARAGINRYRNPLDNGDRTSSAEIGLPHGSAVSGIPSLVFTTGSLERLGGQPWMNRDQNELTVFGSESLSVLRGNHQFKFGGEIARLHYNTRGAGNQRGTLAFDGSRNGLIPAVPGNERIAALADFLLGLPFEASITTGRFGRGYRQWTYAGFFQDTFRVTPRLTLNYGVRFDFTAPWTEVNRKLSNFLPDRGLLTPDQGLSRLYQPDWNNFGPRFGFAYDLGGRGRTILRAGLGILYETLLQANSVQLVEDNPPFSASAVTRSPLPFSVDGSPSRTLLEVREQALPSRSIAGLAPDDFRNPYTIQFALSLKQLLAQDWSLEVGYAGTRGVKLPMVYNVNQVPITSLNGVQRVEVEEAIAARSDTTRLLQWLRPYPEFDVINRSANIASSSYHGMQIKIEKRLQGGLSLLGGYTWAKSIDNASDYASFDPSELVLNSADLNAQRSLSSFDIRNRVTLAFSYVLPFDRGWWFTGWQINGNITAQSGQPFTPYTSVFDPFRNEGFNRPNVIGDPFRDVPAGQAFDSRAFQAPALGTFGNAGRNIVTGDGFHSVDLSLFRSFRFRTCNLQVRMESVNALNHVNFQGPVTNLTTSPGVFVAAAPPRILQFGVKLSF
ncbi:MAG: TonB-dependent receptor [Acidobacteriota bacterium]